jgi:murein L,D-transpeptidase YcbB/YkuD
MRQRWRTAWMLGLLAAVPVAARAQAPLERGLILSSMEAAIGRPAEVIEDFSITVDLSDRTLYLLSGDEVVRSWPVSVGMRSYPTPKGDFRIRRIDWNPSWRPPPSGWARDRSPEPPGSPANPMGRVKIFFRAPDYYIHGTGHAGSLGGAASHGCIRMRNIDAVELARIVMVNGGEERPQKWYEDVLEQKETTRQVALSKPVRVRIRE